MIPSNLSKEAAELASTSEEYQRLEYSLKLSLGAICQFKPI